MGETFSKSFKEQDDVIEELMAFSHRANNSYRLDGGYIRKADTAYGRSMGLQPR